MKTLVYSDQAKTFVQSVDVKMKQRFKRKLESLAKGETEGRFLRKPLQNYQRLRIGSYRIIYQVIPDNVIYIRTIDHRGRVYGAS